MTVKHDVTTITDPTLKNEYCEQLILIFYRLVMLLQTINRYYDDDGGLDTIILKK